MILSKIYSNRKDVFDPVHFSGGINIVRGAVTRKAGEKVDTHNLGKTTFIQLLNFCLLKKSTSINFMQNAKFLEAMHDVCFFLEILLDDDKSFLTIRRTVCNSSRVSFKMHQIGDQDYSELAEEYWDHLNVGLETAKTLLDSYLDWNLPSDVSYRNLIPFIIREQHEYSDVFQKTPALMYNKLEWKLIMARIFGFNDNYIREIPAVETRIAELKAIIANFKPIVLVSEEKSSKQVEEKLCEVQAELEKIQAQIKELDLQSAEDSLISELTEVIDKELQVYNEKIYMLTCNKKRIEESLSFKPHSISYRDVVELYSEMKIAFPGFLKKDLEDLIAFNQAILRERRPILQEELANINKVIAEISRVRRALNEKRIAVMEYIKSTSSFSKLKQLTSKLGEIQVRIESINSQKIAFQAYENALSDKNSEEEKKKSIIASIKSMVNNSLLKEGSVYSVIKKIYSRIILNTLGKTASIDVAVKQTGGLDYKATFKDGAGDDTDEGKGNTYSKMLCIAFDLSMILAHESEKFPRFIIHDGMFEYIEERIKYKLLEVVNEFSESGIQHIITLIDSDMPAGKSVEDLFGEGANVILTLTDNDDAGLLFKGVRW